MYSKRQNEMIRYLSEVKFSKVEELAGLFHVSVETVRRDLLELEKESAVKRVRGGAVYNSLRAREMEFEKRMESSSAEKRAIARLAVEYIHSGDAIVMNNGTGRLELARCLLESGKQVTVVTNSPDIATILNMNKENSVYLTAGYMRKHNKSLVGSMCSDCLSNFKVDKTIICVDGISIEEGVTEYNTEEAAVLRKMVEIGHTCMLLCEYGRFNEVAFNKICEAGKIQYVFTDWNVPAKEVKAWGEVRVKVIAAPEREIC